MGMEKLGGHCESPSSSNVNSCQILSEVFQPESVLMLDRAALKFFKIGTMACAIIVQNLLTASQLQQSRCYLRKNSTSQKESQGFELLPYTACHSLGFVQLPVLHPKPTQLTNKTLQNASKLLSPQLFLLRCKLCILWI